MNDSPLKARYRALLPSLGRMETLLTSILDLEGHASFTDIDPDSNAEYAYARDRIFANARLIRHKLEVTDPLLLSEFGLAAMHNTTTGVFNELNAFAANRNLAHLVNARAGLDGTIYTQMWAFFPEGGSGPLDSAQLDAMRQVQERAIKSVEELKVAHEVALDLATVQQVKVAEELSATQETALAKLTANAHELANLMSSATTEVKALTDQVAQQRSENAATIAKLERDYAETEQMRSERFATLLAQQSSDYATRSQSADAEVAALLARLQEQEGRVLKLVEAMGTKGITANYSAIAKRELFAADVWRVITIAIFTGGIGVAIWILEFFMKDGIGKLNPIEIAMRFGFALAITSPALYTARESARHRTTGDRARQAELELASLGPFIANLERDTQDSIRRGLVAMYFGRQQDAHTAESPVKFKDVSNLAVDLVKATRDVAEKKK